MFIEIRRRGILAECHEVSQRLAAHARPFDVHRQLVAAAGIEDADRDGLLPF